MGRAGFVVGSALAALAAGTIGFLVCCGYQDYWANTWRYIQQLWNWCLLVASFPVAAGISAYLSIRNPRFHKRAQWAQTVRLCVLTYSVYAPLLAVSLYLAPESFLNGWGYVIFILGFPSVVAYTVIPFLLLEYVIVCMARSQMKRA